MPSDTDDGIGGDIDMDVWHVVYRKCTPAWAMAENRLEGINMTYVIQGAARYTVDDVAVDVAGGSLLVLPKGSVRRAVTFPENLMHCFSVDFTLRDGFGREPDAPLPFVSSPGLHRNVVHWFHEMSFAWIERNPGYMIKCRGLFMQIFHRFLELLVYGDGSLAGDFRITKIIRHVARNYRERLTVKSMAEMVGLNPTYFGELFRRTAGVSFNRYLAQVRVRNAENMLVSGEYKVGDVAEACGFADASHFYKLFRGIKGFSPSQCLPRSFDV